MLLLYNANFLYGFNPFLLNCIKLPNFDGSNDILPNPAAPWLQKGRKIPKTYVVVTLKNRLIQSPAFLLDPICITFGIQIL